jgi:HPt (histidine-containing phosphotransfer) domain-containing protein
LEEALQTGQTEKLVRSAHSFKGSSNNMGLEQLAALCGQLEKESHNMPAKDIKRLLEAIERKSTESACALKQFVQTPDFKPAE